MTRRFKRFIGRCKNWPRAHKKTADTHFKKEWPRLLKRKIGRLFRPTLDLLCCNVDGGKVWIDRNTQGRIVTEDEIVFF